MLQLQNSARTEARHPLDVEEAAPLVRAVQLAFWLCFVLNYCAVRDVPMFFHSAGKGSLIISEGLEVNARTEAGYSLSTGTPKARRDE